MDSRGDDLTTWSAVRSWILDHADDEGRIELTQDGGLVLHRPRSRVAIVEAGAHLPDTFEVLVVVGAGESLRRAVMNAGHRRVQLLTLPVPRWGLERVLLESVAAADAFALARTADHLLEIGRALNTQRDPARVLEMILRHAREITAADAGSVYVVEDGGVNLRFKFAQNDSVAADFSEFVVPVTEGSVVGTAVLSKKTVRIEDLYESGHSQTHGRNFHHDRTFDRKFGYETRSILTAPMITPDGKVLAVIQLINAKCGMEPLQTPKDFLERIRPFTAEDERLCDALAAQAAVALENASLYADIQALFEGFVRASVHAIEQRDPTTSGHSHRVAELTVNLAKAVDRVTTSPFAHVTFDAEQLREIEYAGLLHDFGKVGVREEVLVKAKKLHSHELERVMERFDHMRTALALELLAEERHGDTASRPSGADRAHGESTSRPTGAASRLAELDALIATVLEANEPSVMNSEISPRLEAIERIAFHNSRGAEVEVLGPREIQALRIRRGSLTDTEREEINGHVVHTYNFLVRIPWTTRLAGVPEIAGKHHEYLDGSGYPRRLRKAGIPLPARMMTIADIFDALTATDRPYKPAIPAEAALDILRDGERRGKLDGDLLDLFIATRVYATGSTIGGA